MENNLVNDVKSVALQPDTLLHGRYRIQKLLSKGGFSITYIAHDKTLNMSTVVKEFMPKSMLEREKGTTEMIVKYAQMQQSFDKGAENFLNEARILAKFSDCEGVVSVIDYFAENNTAYIVMPYVQGTTLSEFIPKNGGLKESETIELLTPVIAALSKVHKAGIIHRDISPDNILITEDKKAILLDFGICLPIENESKEAVQERPTSLKHGYAPPEQYCYRGIQGPWTDIYSMAATMYFCIEGKSLIPAVNRMHQQKDIGESRIHFAIKKGISLMSKDRYANMDEFLAALTKQPKKANIQFAVKSATALLIVALAFAAGYMAKGMMSSAETENNQHATDYKILATAETTPYEEQPAETNEPVDIADATPIPPANTAATKEYALLNLGDDDPIPFADANLENAIREEINKPEGDITMQDISEIRSLNMLSKNIESLDGIQYFKNLTWLDVGNNFISDLAPVQHLEYLNMLRVNGNLVYDIDTLENCLSISELDLASNYIEDVSALETLVNLTWLDLHSNRVSDATPIMNLPKLQWLNISSNTLGDYSYLANLPRIEELSICGDTAYAYAFEDHPTLIRFEP